MRDLPFLLIRLQLTYTFPVNRDVADLFYELVDLTPAQRETYFLEQSVAPEVRLQVESLLAFDSADEHLLTAPVAQWAEQLAAQTRGTARTDSLRTLPADPNIGALQNLRQMLHLSEELFAVDRKNAAAFADLQGGLRFISTVMARTGHLAEMRQSIRRLLENPLDLGQ